MSLIFFGSGVGRKPPSESHHFLFTREIPMRERPSETSPWECVSCQIENRKHTLIENRDSETMEIEDRVRREVPLALTHVTSGRQVPLALTRTHRESHAFAKVQIRLSKTETEP